MDQNVVDSITDTIERVAKAYFKTKGINLDIPNKPLTSYGKVVSYADYCQKKQDDIHEVPYSDEGDTDGDESVHQVSVDELVNESFRNDIPDAMVEVEAEAEVETEVPDDNKNDITEE